MRFWDASAVVPLIVPESASLKCTDALAADPLMIVWALTPVEALSALYRKHREKRVSDGALAEARQRLDELRGAWTEVRDLKLVQDRAERLLALHTLRAADALQLASALIACSEQPAALPLVCMDPRLTAAARAEGFPIVPA